MNQAGRRKPAARGAQLALVVTIFAILSIPSIASAADTPSTAAVSPEAASQFFLDNCTACHTIGEGDGAGPDLLPATKYAEHDLHEAVERMEMHVGEISSETVDGLVLLLRDPTIKQRLADAGKEAAAAAPPAPPAFPENGRQLFFGEKPLAGGGTPCFACHAVNGRGGSLAADLTLVHARLGDTGIVAVSERPAFPMMKAAYATHPVATQEARDLAAFLATAATQVPAGAKPRAEGVQLLHGLAAALALATLLLVALIFRSKGNSVRSALVRNSSEGKTS